MIYQAHMTVAIDGNHQLRRLKRNEQDMKKATCNILFKADKYQELFGGEVEKSIPHNSDAKETCRSNFDAANLSLQAIKKIVFMNLFLLDVCVSITYH